IPGSGRGEEGPRGRGLNFAGHGTGASAARGVALSEWRASVARDGGHPEAGVLCLGHALAGDAEHGARMHSSKERMWLARPLLWGRCDADDPIRTVVRAEVERSVGPLDGCAEPAVRTVEEDSRGLEGPIGLLLEAEKHRPGERREEQVSVPRAPCRAAHERVAARRD